MVNQPHELPFQYDYSLLASCASSALAAHVLHQPDESIDYLAEDELSSSSSSHQSSPLRRNNNNKSNKIHNGSGSSDCRALFKQHGEHYHRPPFTEMEEQFWDSWIHNVSDEGIHNSEINPTLRIEAFLKSVLFVHEHNTNVDNQHEVALNRFSDRAEHELPLLGPKGDDGGGSSSFDHSPFGVLDHASLEHLEASLDNLFSMQHGMINSSKKNERSPMFVPLNDEKTIMNFGEKIRKLQLKRMQLQRAGGNAQDFMTDLASYSIRFQSMMHDAWWWVGGHHQFHDQSPDEKPGDDSSSSLSSRQKQSKDSDNKSKDNSFSIDKNNELGGLEEKEDSNESVDEWSKRLNWATNDNPDGVPLVHPAMDQGLCGSCWAVSATGTLEASIARNMAYIAYEDAYNYFSSSSSSTSSSSTHAHDKNTANKKQEQQQHQQSTTEEDATTFAVLAAQEIERQSINTAELSVQELVDCDTRYDQGCAGGNPLLAFYFLHRFGITSTKNYPYTGVASSCRYHKIDQPIATVSSWGILTPDHEHNMEKVLRFIGPVAVGLIGADPAFLAYKKGIFMSSRGGKCDLGQADHAMLITGYGEEVSKDGTVSKYWIARNSWGSGWGENGYVRVARLGGRKGHRGVCGIAHSPSVALGGMFTKDIELDKNGLYGSTLSGERVQSSGNNGSSGQSAVKRGSSQIQSVIHQIRTRLGFVQKHIMMSTISGNEDRDVSMFLPCVAASGLLVVCLTLALAYHKRKRRRQLDIQRQGSSEEESVCTNWSTVGLYNGIHEHHISCGISHEANNSIRCNSEERIHLLEGSSGILYT